MNKYYRIVNYYIHNDKVNNDLKLAVISDLHFSSNTKPVDMNILLNQLKEINPQYILIPGDLIDYKSVLKNKEIKEFIIQFMKELSIIAPVKLSIGNHDLDSLEDGYLFGSEFTTIFDLINSIDNVEVLDNKKSITNNLLVSGYTQSHNVYYNDKKEDSQLMFMELNNHEELLKTDISVPSIMLIHSPIHITDDNINELLCNYDIVVSGHMHEGMMPPLLDDFIPGNRGLISPAKLPFANNARGYKKLGGNRFLFISGGITKLASSSPKLFHTYDVLYPSSIEVINIKNDKTISNKVLKKVKYVKGV